MVTSTGQQQKSDPNCVSLVVHASGKDASLEGAESESLGALAKAVAVGDMLTLSDRGRRVVHLHLPHNSRVALCMLERAIREVVDEIEE